MIITCPVEMVLSVRFIYSHSFKISIESMFTGLMFLTKTRMSLPL